MKKERPVFLFWIDYKTKALFFSPKIGLERISFPTEAEMKQVVYSYVESGYKVG